MTIEKFLTIERGVETVRAKPEYKANPNPIIEDFWSLIEAYRALLLENEKLKGKPVG